MANEKDATGTWTHNERPQNLHRRFEFDSYADNRDFLDRVADLSKETGLYPDISFGKTYANITIHAEEGASVSDSDRDFAARVDAAFKG